MSSVSDRLSYLLETDAEKRKIRYYMEKTYVQEKKNHGEKHALSVYALMKEHFLDRAHPGAVSRASRLVLRLHSGARHPKQRKIGWIQVLEIIAEEQERTSSSLQQ